MTAATSFPVWLPGLFVGLVVLGWTQSRPRTVQPTPLVVVAVAALGLSLWGVVSAFGAQPAALLAWAFGYATTLFLAGGLLVPAGLRAVGNGVHLPRSWAPMALILGIFSVKFLLGYATAVHAPWLQSPAVVAVLCVLLGGFSGGFAARAAAVWRCARGARAA